MHQKITLFVFFILISPNFILAQKKNAIGVPTLAGSISYDYSKKQDNYTSNLVNTGINFGYLVNKNWMPGIALAYQIETTNFVELDNTNKNTKFSISPFVRYNISSKNSLGFFAEAAISYSLNNTSNPTTNTNYNWTEYGISLNPGISYVLNRRIAFESKIGAIYYRKSESNTNFGINLIPSNINLGMRFLFTKKSKNDKNETKLQKNKNINAHPNSNIDNQSDEKDNQSDENITDDTNNDNKSNKAETNSKNAADSERAAQKAARGAAKKAESLGENKNSNQNTNGTGKGTGKGKGSGKGKGKGTKGG